MRHPHTDIALVIAGLGPGGAQRVVTRLANFWAESGQKVALVTLYQEEQPSFFPLSPAVSLRCVQARSVRQTSTGWLSGLTGNLRTIWRLRQTLKELNPKVSVGFVFATNILLVLAALGLPCRTIISERNDPAKQSGGRLWDFLRAKCYRLADCVTANSQLALRTLEATVPREKLVFVPNPLDEPLDVSGAKRQKRILAVGRLNHQKAYDILLDAFAEFSQAYADWRLSIIGVGELEQALKARAENLGISDRVEWVGAVSDPRTHFSESSIFTMPSRHEGTPNALLEAMQHQLPVIVSDTTGGALDYVKNQESGLIVKSEDRRSLCEAMKQLATDAALRDRLGQRAKQAVAGNSLSQVIQIWEGVLGVNRAALCVD